MWTCAGVLALAACACAVTRDQFYPNGAGLDQRLPRGGEVASPEVPLKVPVVFYGETYESIFVNNYGVLSFRADISSFLNSEFPLPYPSIAAFYTNVDTSESGAIYYRETDEPHVLIKAEESVQNNFHDYYDFKPTSVFIATWIDVTYSSLQRTDKKNSFQIAIISNGTESFVELLYPEREIQWIQKEAQPGSLPDAKAQAGFIAEDGRLFTLRGSGSHQIRNIVSWSNTHEPGKYVFRVGNLPPEGNIAVPDQYNEEEVEVEEESKTCAQSGPSVCHIQARCVDYQAGICCQCNEGFYGNGKSCVKDDVPLRLHGKLNGIINDISLDDVDIQSYVVVADGRSYTALSLAPPALGSSLQLLNVLGGVVGWLFAKPAGTAKNGYQLTGSIFNHTAHIFFPATGDRVTISQEYLGHDVFDQITIESDVRGTIPVIPPGMKLETSEYEEQYTTTQLGVVQSESTRSFTNRVTGEKYELRVSQSFSFNPCRFAPPSEEDNIPSTLKVAKNYLGYEAKDNIVRYGMSNKIVPLGQEDPCIVGRSTCGPHSTCVAQSDSFTCVCQTGFTNIYLNDQSACIDIDECAAGTHTCDHNADCYNHDGGYQCICKAGFEGNGETCKPVSQCREKNCGANAQCIENPGTEARCVCSIGYVGDGYSCLPAQSFYCDGCSSYASCVPSNDNTFSCRCNVGYSGDGYTCVEEPPLPTTTAAPTEADYNERFVLPSCDDYSCACPPGYSSFRDEGNNELCSLDAYRPETTTEDTVPDNLSNTYYRPEEPSAPQESHEPEQTNLSHGDNDSSLFNGNSGGDGGAGDNSIQCISDLDCPPNAACIDLQPDPYAEGQYVGHCVCPEGYEGDAYECIERTSNTCSCGPNAHCIDTANGEFICMCDSGYHGDGYICRPNFSCNNNSDCEYNAECRPDPVNRENVCQCIEGYIKDQSDACIRDAQLCNGAVCAEHASCLFDDTIGISYCHCDSGYEGEGIDQCVPKGLTCNEVHDCHPDAICAPTDSSYQCVCKEGYIGDGYTCTLENNCRNNPFLCDNHASCLKRNEVYVCECNAGYNGNGSSCVLNPRQSGNFLIATDGASVYRVPFQVTPRNFATPVNSIAYQIAVGVDVDCQTGRIYWGDVVGNTIKRAAYDGSGFEHFLSNTVKAPEGIAIDWSARNVFWTDSKKLTIEVANMDTKIRKALFAIDGLSNPRGIAVHPQRGKVFWSDWNRALPKIEWANMDGSERGVFLDSSEVKLPNSLAIDWVRDRLCYSDAGHLSIKCVSIDTFERETVATNCSHPFGLAINGDKFYWTDWKTLKIEYIDARTQVRGQVPVASASRRLYGVAVAPDDCPSYGNVCQYRNGNCQPGELCLPDGRGGRSCVAGEQGY